MSLKDSFKQLVQRFLATPFSRFLIRSFFRKPVLVITQAGSQLGNQLTIFAHVIASSIELGREVRNTSLYRYGQYFEVTSRDLWARFPEKNSIMLATKTTRYWLYQFFTKLVRLLVLNPSLCSKELTVVTDYERKQSLSDPEFLARIAPHRVVLVEGYFFRTSSELIKKHALRIKQHFQFLKCYEQNAQTLVRNLKTSYDLVVGIHLRQFDPVHDGIHPLYQYDHVDQMNKVMRQVASFFPDRKVVFLLSSNKKINLEQFSEFSVKEASGHIAEDLRVLSLCDYLVASTYSTYSRWASFFGDVPFYQIHDPDAVLTLDDFRIQIPGMYDPANEAHPILV